MRTSVPDDRPVKLVNAGTGQVLEAGPGGTLADTRAAITQWHSDILNEPLR